MYGKPDQIDLDILYKDDTLIICDIKSSMSKADMYSLERKVRFYEQQHRRTASRVIAISPMVDPRAKEVAEHLHIEVYSYPEGI